MSPTVGTGPFAKEPAGRFNTRSSRRPASTSSSTQFRSGSETGLLPRYYFPPAEVRLDLLEPSPTLTRCTYEGVASHFHALGHDDAAWTYPEPENDAEPVRDLIAFHDERVDTELDGESAERPHTQRSR
jgi:uncharacterized protein (DUF427 family)